MLYLSFIVRVVISQPFIVTTISQQSRDIQLAIELYRDFVRRHGIQFCPKDMDEEVLLGSKTKGFLRLSFEQQAGPVTMTMDDVVVDYRVFYKVNSIIAIKLSNIIRRSNCENSSGLRVGTTQAIKAR